MDQTLECDSSDNQCKYRHTPHRRPSSQLKMTLIAKSVVVNVLAIGLTLSLVALVVRADGQASNQAAAAASSPIPASGRLTLEELNSIVRQHDNVEGNDKKLAEALISKILVDNIANNPDGAQDQLSLASSSPVDLSSESVDGDALALGQQAYSPSALPLDWRLKQWLNNYQNLYDGSEAFMPFPSLANGPLGTIKRAAKMAAKNHQRTSSYGRANYDFGLGKRPDSSGSLVSRYGELSSSSLVQPVSQFGKRPSAHRYDFGLGKRVASPTYPRYDFGLGKRAPNYVRYDFGLGK